MGKSIKIDQRTFWKI